MLGELIGVSCSVHKIHIKNEKLQKNKMIFKKDLEMFENDGWSPGRLKP